MAREKFQTLTEQMFYILLCLQQECCGVDIMERVRQMTHDRVVIGPGTLYSLLESFQQEDFIRVTKVEGRKKSYRITTIGRLRLAEEVRRLRQQTEDYEKYGEEVYT
ncbi:MAG: PadR family transcriptional regulator [Oscillospiraceae bacterium]|nr:PadR family transcriptional regulator [Oscillospiraceae bacterium]